MGFKKAEAPGNTKFLKLNEIIGQTFDLTLVARRPSEREHNGKVIKSMTYICIDNDSGIQVGYPGFGQLDNYWLREKPLGTRFRITYHGKQLVTEGDRAGTECHQCEMEFWEEEGGDFLE